MMGWNFNLIRFHFLTWPSKSNNVNALAINKACYQYLNLARKPIIDPNGFFVNRREQEILFGQVCTISIYSPLSLSMFKWPGITMNNQGLLYILQVCFWSRGRSSIPCLNRPKAAGLVSAFVPRGQKDHTRCVSVSGGMCLKYWT